EQFKDKKELLLEVIESDIRNKNGQYFEIISETDNVIEAMFLITEKEMLFMSQLSPILVEDMKKYTSLIQAHFCANKEKNNEYVVYQILQKGQSEGIFRDYLKIDVVDGFLYDMSGFLHNDTRIRLRHVEKEDVFRNIFLPYFRGLCTQKGIDLMDKYFPIDKQP
ncbi:MAG: hypothetical protein FWG22_04825, partial [Prolixibacteraceae bacterium]|nr:hypothetical protein [Prolixibacteraceae bacterium]